MAVPATAVYVGGIACTSDGAVYVEPTGSASITGGSITGVTGIPVLLAQSFVAVSGAADTAENALATITIAAGLMAANSAIILKTYWSHTNSGNSKTLRVRLNGIGGTAYLNAAVTTTATSVVETLIANRATVNSQVGGLFSTITQTFGSSTNGAVTSAVDTSAGTNIVITGTKASAGETLTLEGYTAWLVKT